MKIIRHGEKYRKVVRFTCECGCVFDADESEYLKTYDPATNDIRYIMSCPECKASVNVEEEIKE